MVSPRARLFLAVLVTRAFDWRRDSWTVLEPSAEKLCDELRAAGVELETRQRSGYHKPEVRFRTKVLV